MTVFRDLPVWRSGTAVGPTVLSAATGCSPFGEGRPHAVIYRLVHEEPHLDGVDTRLLPLVSSALAKNPRARPTPDRLLVGVVQRAMPASVSSVGNEALTTALLDPTWRGSPPPVIPKVPSKSRRAPRNVWDSCRIGLPQARAVPSARVITDNQTFTRGCRPAPPRARYRGHASPSHQERGSPRIC